MSRIHEALQKAQREQAESTELPGLPDIEGLGAISAATLPVLSGGPLAAAMAKLVPGNWSLPRTPLILNSHEGGVLWEPFRRLRWHLKQCAEKGVLKSVLITSAEPDEGKTFVCSNLGSMFARRKGNKVLVVDGDLRRGRLSATFGAKSGPGLSEYLRGTASLEQVIQRAPKTELYLMPAGPRPDNIAELLHGTGFRTGMEELRSVFDWIFIDSPATLAVTDATELAVAADGVLIVARANATARDSVKKALTMFPQQVLGVVLNGVRPEECEVGTYPGYYTDSRQKP